MIVDRDPGLAQICLVGSGPRLTVLAVQLAGDRVVTVGRRGVCRQTGQAIAFECRCRPGKECAVPHREARAAGEADRAAGEQRQAGRWPPGTYGHADYVLGWVGHVR